MVWIADPSLRTLGERIATGKAATNRTGPMVRNLEEFLRATRDQPSLAYVDATVMPELSRAGASLPAAIIGVTGDPLASAINWLQPHPWLSHVVSASMLDHPMARWHYENITATFGSQQKPRLLDWLGPEVCGRRIRLAKSIKRVERLERMSDFLADKGVGARTIQQLRDAAEELLTNAFYDAPVSAGAFREPVSRTLDVTLPDSYACDLAYGCREDLAIVRVKDPFGSLSRRRLVEVLTRCARSDMAVEVDESMGGAGLGMWRIFSAATFVAISVVGNRHTEILVGIAKRASGPKPFAFHLFFQEGGKPRSWKQFVDEAVQPSNNNAVMFAAKAR